MGAAENNGEINKLAIFLAEMKRQMDIHNTWPIKSFLPGIVTCHTITPSV